MQPTANHWRRAGAAIALAVAATAAQADAITDWSVKAGEIITESKMGTPPAVRATAYINSAVYEAVNAITRRYPAQRVQIDAPAGASVDAAIAAANRTALLRLMPAQQASIDAAYQAALAAIPESPAKFAGVAVGEKAAAALFAARSEDSAAGADTYRPHTSAGAYVPTATPAVVQWTQRKPWVMTSADAVPPRPAARADERRLDARLPGGQADRRQGEHGAHARADRDRTLLGLLAADDLPGRGALRGHRSGPRRHRQCAPVRSRHAGDG